MTTKKIETAVKTVKTKAPLKVVMNYNRLYKTGVAQHIGQIFFNKDGMRTDWKDGIDTKALTRPGYYFIVKKTQALSRYFVASKKGIDGFNSVLRNLRNGRTSVDKKIIAEKRVQVYFVPADNANEMLDNLHLDKMLGKDFEQHIIDTTFGQTFTLDNQILGKYYFFKFQNR